MQSASRPGAGVSLPDLIFVDTETTGFSPARGAVAIEIAAMRVAATTGQPVARFSSLIAPPTALADDEAHWGVHGIAPAEVRRAPAAPLVWQGLRDTLGLDTRPVRWIAHPARFDQPFWTDWLQRADPQAAARAGVWGCSLTWLKRQRRVIGVEPQWRSARTGQLGPSDKIEAWAAALGLTPQGPLHRAATDTDLLVRIVQAVRRRGGQGWP